MERLVCVAIKRYSEVYGAQAQFRSYDELRNDLGYPTEILDSGSPEDIEGFMTDMCRFVVDDGAADIALSAAQIKMPVDKLQPSEIRTWAFYSNEKSECEHCDGLGRVFNNADKISGMFVQCEECKDVRGML